MTVVATIIVLGVLIFVHELGHFAAAKAVGVEVQRFSIGLGPKVFGFTRGETEYVLSAIPLGGYVKMGGMDDEVMDRLEGGDAEPRQPSERDFDAKPIWARTLVISAGVIMNMLFAFGVYTFVAAYWGEAHRSTTVLGKVDAALLPEGTGGLADVEPGSRFVRVGGEDIAYWTQVQQGLYEAEPGPLSVEFADPARTVQIDIPVSEGQRVRLVQAVQRWIDAGVGVVNPGSPAAKAGLEQGDVVLAVDGIDVDNWFEFVSLIEARGGQRAQLSIVREGRELVRPVDVEREEVTGVDGRTREVGRIGIYPPPDDYLYLRIPVGEAVVSGYEQTIGVSGLILGFLRDLVTGGVSPRQMGSIVTIGEASGNAAEAGLDQFLQFMALFSVNLAVLNLLPIPVLDGGHLLFLAIEAVRGRALSMEQRLRWSNVGFLIVMGIMLWALSNDFLRLLGL